MAAAVNSVLTVLSSLNDSDILGPMFSVAIGVVGISAALGLFFRRG